MNCRFATGIKFPRKISSWFVPPTLCSGNLYHSLGSQCTEHEFPSDYKRKAHCPFLTKEQWSISRMHQSGGRGRLPGLNLTLVHSQVFTVLRKGMWGHRFGKENKNKVLIQEQKAHSDIKYHLPRTEHRISDQKGAERRTKEDFGTKDIEHSIENRVKQIKMQTRTGGAARWD